MRVKRIKEAGSYFYYLAKNEEEVNIEVFSKQTDILNKSENKQAYGERDLHKLLSSYLKI